MVAPSNLSERDASRVKAGKWRELREMALRKAARAVQIALPARAKECKLPAWVRIAQETAGMPAVKFSGRSGRSIRSLLDRITVRSITLLSSRRLPGHS